MRAVILPLILAAVASAAVPFNADLTKGSVSLRVERRADVADMLGRRAELLLIHLQSSNADTARFAVTIRARLQNGSTRIIRETVNRHASIPGTAWSTLTLSIGSVEEILSITVEEITDPRISDFS